jgi:hypothetical protein
MKRFIKKINAEGRPYVFYIHPWELDPDQPKVGLPFTDKFRHYHGLANTESKLDKLLSDFHFAPIREILRACKLI